MYHPIEYKDIRNKFCTVDEIIFSVYFQMNVGRMLEKQYLFHNKRLSSYWIKNLCSFIKRSRFLSC